MKKCERCGAADAIRGERYCKACKKIVLRELREGGYLTSLPYTAARSREQMENCRETKYGTDR